MKHDHEDELPEDELPEDALLEAGMSDEDDAIDDEDGTDDDEEQLPQRVEVTEPVEPEQIGPLIFVPNAEYPYPFDVETPPRFWMEETTGVLNEAVDAYMNGERLSPSQIDVIKIYLRQFIERAKLAGAANRRLLLSKIDKIKKGSDIERFADELSEYGGEVF
jgi:hypothetical protein